MASGRGDRHSRRARRFAGIRAAWRRRVPRQRGQPGIGPVRAFDASHAAPCRALGRRVRLRRLAVHHRARRRVPPGLLRADVCPPAVAGRRRSHAAEPGGAGGGGAARRADGVAPEPARSDNYVNLGDNLFRAGNRHRAEQRYTQAARLNPNSARPHVRLAQVALARGDYTEAAEEFRAATTAEPGWLINATDVQALFGEPGDFAQVLAKLETHLQATPNDRDGWLVLGAEWYLSGRARQAADVFTRLNDRKPDATLASFLDATTPDAMARAPQ